MTPPPRKHLAAPSALVSSDAPEWFRRALAAPVETGFVAAAGVEIAYRAWGPPGADGVVLVHGGSAHSRWWDHIAPLLAEGRRVVALDLSGHGDSGRRSEYSLTSWAREVMSVIDDAAFPAPPVVVGHSMGGFVALQSALEYGNDLAGIVVVDSPVQDHAHYESEAFERRATQPQRRYPSRAAALQRFQLLPDQEVKLDYVLDHVAETSVAERDGYWTWKFDPLIFRDPFLGLTMVTPLSCRLALLRAGKGRLTAQLSASVQEKISHTALEVEIPEAGHHVMLDQPLALIATIRTVFSCWAAAAGATPANDRAGAL